MFLEISQNSQENACATARASFLIKLQAWGFGVRSLFLIRQQLYEKETPTQAAPCEICEIFKKTILKIICEWLLLDSFAALLLWVEWYLPKINKMDKKDKTLQRIKKAFVNILTLSFIMLKNCQKYFKSFVVWTRRDFKLRLTMFFERIKGFSEKSFWNILLISSKILMKHLTQGKSVERGLSAQKSYIIA